MKEIKSLLKIMSDGLKTIAQGVEAISAKVDDITKSQTDLKRRAKKSVPALPKKKSARRSAAKKSIKKVDRAPTAVETVYKVISRSKKGVDVATLMKKTGYDRKKVANVIYKLGKQGRIKSVKKGVYVKA